jgi:PKD repeat protein/photosystem II stability/assembly factor-like uncharacterized protein
MKRYLRLPILALLSVSLFAPALFANSHLVRNDSIPANTSWTNHYPDAFMAHGPGGGGYTYAPSISPHDPSHIFLNCDMGGLYRSRDGAQSWQMLHYQYVVSQVKGKVQFTSDPNILYVCRRSTSNLNDPWWRGEIAKSSDGGASWQTMADPTSTGVHRLEVDPTSTQRLLLNEYDRLFFSADGGTSWSQVYLPASGNMWIGGVYWDAANIYVGTNEGLLVSKNNGSSFSLESHSGLPAGTGIYQLSGAKSGATTRLFCLAAPADNLPAWSEPLGLRGTLQGIFRMNYTASAAWTNSRGNIPATVEIAWVDLALNNTQTVWAAAANSNGLPMIFKSTDGGQAWTNTYLLDNNQNISTGWSGDSGAFWLTSNEAPLGFDVSPSDPNQVIVADGTGHITSDGGASWRATYVHPAYQNAAGQTTAIQKTYKSSGLDVTTAHHIYWVNDQNMLVSNTDIGQTYSADAGETWTFARNFFQPWGALSDNNWYHIVRQPSTGHLFAATAEINDLYLSYRISDDVLDNVHGFVAKSLDNGASWDTVHNFGHPVGWLEIDKSNPSKIYASVVHSIDGGIFQSIDGGVSWTKLPNPPRTQGHPYNIISLADGSLVATYSARALTDGVTLTESSGVFLLPAGANSWQDRTAAAMKFYTKDLVVDPHDPTQNTWYATVWGRFTTFAGPINQGNGGLYRTTNRGQSWTRIWANEMAESITIHPDKPGTAYLTAENDGLFFTENIGASPTVERVQSFPFWRPKRVFFKPGNAAELWVTTMGGGIWKGTTAAPGTVTYTPSTEDFANPERGFMQFTETHSNDYVPLNAAELSSWRNLHNPGGDPAANYSIYASLIYRGFYLEDFKNGPISMAYLNALQQDFNAARQAGVKLVIRFAYTQKDSAPFGDAPKNIVLQHITQLKPYLQANADVIAVLQMGFIGAWGEGYYTDYFGFGSLNTQNWTDRTAVVNALLDALPPERSVQVRVPQLKQRVVYGVNAPTTAAPLTAVEAWQNTPKARIGFHNDCFISSESDVGTYENYDFNGGEDTLHLKPYFAADSRYVPVGGETCGDWNPYSDCTSQAGGHAQDEMARMHFSYLNSGWFNDANNDWVSGGCMSEIQKRLGYRLELQNSEVSTEARPGQSVSVKIVLKNVGFAAPFNARKGKILLRNTVTNALWQVDLPEDPRSWLPGNQNYVIQHSFCLPGDLPIGDYDLLFQLADPSPALSNRPEYAIRLANDGVWEAATGFNKLLQQISVHNSAGNPLCAGETCFQPNNGGAPVATFTASVQSGCSPLTVAFSSANAPCLTYEWSFPGASPATSTEANPTVVYPSSGVFSVSLSIANTVGVGELTKTDFINVLATPSVSIQPAGPVYLQYGDSVSLDAGPGFNSYFWSTGAQSQSIVVTACGTYALNIVDVNGCTGSGTGVTVGVAPVVSFANGVLHSTPADNYQWFLNGQAIVGATSQTYQPAASGEYSVYTTCDNDGNGSQSEIFTVVITGISEVASSLQLKLYPNPISTAASSLILEWHDPAQVPFEVVLTDMAGRALMRKEHRLFSEKSILEMGETPAGVYFVQIYSQGKRRATALLVRTN